MQYHRSRTAGHGPDGPVEEVVPDRLGAAPLARRTVPVPAGPRRHRLRDVAESLARLGHPCIASVVDVVDVDDQHVHVLTTFGDGGTLADRPGPLPADEVRALVRELAHALDAAHRVGVAHGHVVDTNVVRAEGRLLLTDFGISEARTGRPRAHPFRDDVRDLATLGLGLLDPADGTTAAASLRALLGWAADDPDADLAALRAGVEPASEPDGPPPPPPPPAEPATDLPSELPSRRHATHAVAGASTLVLGLVAGAAVALGPAVGRSAPVEAAPLACAPVAADLAADVDGDGCEDPLDWRSDAAEVAYSAEDGSRLRFRIGRPGDELVVGDWDCDGIATAAVVRSSTGETFLFDAWAGEGETLIAEAGPSLPVGSSAAVAQDGGCDRIRPAAS
ncbi:hypothetical protein NHL50_10710 [Acidimicrobiia bacterium EGI L10123]|uniref:hypothetical protein n=1 Tax=Salinilacustrithrix flava TaxID=2957203 RepID=UPI003D7C18F3|nr:hypothetical protein [Acidimicrobiia bacterium EGI L10123]